MKHCSTCKLAKTATEFYKSKKSLDGLCHTCKICSLARSKHWRENNPLRKLRVDATYRENNREELRKYFQAYYASNKEKRWHVQMQWRKNNKEHFKFIARQQSARRRSLEKVGKITKQEWQDRLAEYNYHCAYCLKPFDNLEMEHMLPLSRGGTHTIDNIVPACRTCNGTKSSKTLLEILPIPPLDVNQAAL